MEKKKKTPHSAKAFASKPRWSAVDTAIVLLIVATLAVQSWQAILLHREKNTVTVYHVYDVNFTVTSIRRELFSQIEAYDCIYFYEDGVKIGSFGVWQDETDSQTIALKMVEPGPDGIVGSPNVGAKGCMVCKECTMNNGGLAVAANGRILLPGDEVLVKTEKVMLTIRIDDIREHE